MCKYKCPSCGETQQLNVQVSCFVPLKQQNGTETFDSSDAELDWGQLSDMNCASCGTTESASCFNTD